MKQHFTPEERQSLQSLIEGRVLKTSPEPFMLSNGRQSNHYFDCKAVTYDGRGLSLLARAFIDCILRNFPDAQAVGGLTLGADSIAAAVCMKSYEFGYDFSRASIVRKEPKKHGTMAVIENELEKGTRIVVVDDVITSGSSALKAYARFVDAGYHPIGIISLIDREEGGTNNIEQQHPQAPFYAIYNKSEFTKLKQPGIGSANQHDHPAKAFTATA